MIAILNSLPVKEGAEDKIVERFVESRGHAQGFPGFVSMEVLKSSEDDEVLVITRWENRASFDAWERSEEVPSTARTYNAYSHGYCRKIGRMQTTITLPT